jgi:hypothetical protein
VYIDYPSEQVKFRWDHRAGKVYCKPYGKSESLAYYAGELFTDATLYGDEITAEDYSG